jgi:hypothetical protein
MLTCVDRAFPRCLAYPVRKFMNLEQGKPVVSVDVTREIFVLFYFLL